MEHLSVDGSSQDEQDSPEEELLLLDSAPTTTVVGLSTPAGRRSVEGFPELPATTNTPGTQPELEARNYNLNVRMPCSNGQAYSVSQNKVMFLPSCQDSQSPSASVSSVKLRVTELESQQATSLNCRGGGISSQVPDRKGLVLNLTTQFEAAGSKPGSPDESSTDPIVDDDELIAMTQTKLAPQKLQAILVKKEIWDPAEHRSNLLSTSPSSSSLISRIDVNGLSPNKSASDPQWISPRSCSPLIADLPPAIDELGTQVTEVNLISGKASSPTPPPKVNDPFSAQLDRVFDREERRQQRLSTSMPVEASTLNIVSQEKLLSSSMETALPATLRDCPSRQSSWSSYDSAVVLGYQGEPREAPSRQSSWGSADTRWTYGTLPSRNSSWGSYDIRPTGLGCGNVTEREEKTQQLQQQIPDDLESFFSNTNSGMFSYDREAIPWYPGTVKRTKQKLEAEVTTKRMCSESGVPISQSSPPTSDSICDMIASSPPVISNSTATLRFQTPRPYHNPAAVSSSVSFVTAPSNKMEPSGYEPSAASGVQPLIHYASSPTLCQKRVDDEMIVATVPEKMAISQPNISSYLAPSSMDIQQTTLHNNSNIQVKRPDILESDLCITSPLKANFPQCPTVKKSLEELVIKLQPIICSEEQSSTRPSLLQATSTCVATAVTQESGATRLSDEVSQPSTTPGVVKSLKKEFEAKSVRKERAVSAIEPGTIKDGDLSPELKLKLNSDKIKSLPSSPVSNNCVPQSISASGTPVEDLTVKMLVDKFEVSRNNGNEQQPTFCRSISDSPPNSRTRFLSENNSSCTKRRSSPAGIVHQPPVPPRKSSFEITAASGANVIARNMRNGNENRSNRLPPPAQPSNNVLLAIAKPKKQQGKTHPLARLTINKPRHNNPVYNTM